MHIGLFRTRSPAPFVDVAAAGLDFPEAGDMLDGLWHVTVAADRVRAEGLRSRRDLGWSVQGLGGGADDQASGMVSATWSADRAAMIVDGLRTRWRPRPGA